MAPWRSVVPKQETARHLRWVQSSAKLLAVRFPRPGEEPTPPKPSTPQTQRLVVHKRDGTTVTSPAMSAADASAAHAYAMQSWQDVSGRPNAGVLVGTELIAPWDVANVVLVAA